MNIFFLISFVILFVYTVFTQYRLNRLNNELKQVKEYNKSLIVLNDSLRGFKHDFSNILTAMGGYIVCNDFKGLKLYYSTLMNDCKKINNLNVLNPNVINNPAIYAIISDKYYKADENGISLNLDIFMNLNSINLNMYEFTKILRNLNG